jgi:hypothetical protein
MSKILTPGAQPLSLLQWMDAYSMFLESTAEAKNNTELRTCIEENIKALKGSSKGLAGAADRQLLATQEQIKAFMGFSLDMYKAKRLAWKNVCVDVRAASWNLAEDIHYTEQTKGGYHRFWQGDKDATEGGLVVDRVKALVLIQFLKFVNAQSTQNANPIEYTKQMLLKQGINEHNFHKHADAIAFPNPWTVAL